jgi:hypothetical protein
VTGSAASPPVLATLVAPDGRSSASLSNAWTLGAPRAAIAYEATLGGTPIVAWPGPASGVEAPMLLDGRGPGDPRLLRVGARGWVRDVRVGRGRVAAFASATSSGFVRGGGRPVRHRRALCLFFDGALAVVDDWSGRGTARVEMRLPLAPGVVAEPSGDGARLRGPGGPIARLVAPGLVVGLARARDGEAAGALAATADLTLPARTVHAWSAGSEAPTVAIRTVGVGDVRVELTVGGTTLAGRVPRWEAP